MLLQPSLHHQKPSLSSTIRYSRPLPWKNPDCVLRQTVNYRKLPITCSISQIHNYGTVDYERRPMIKWNSIYRSISLMENPELGAGTVLNKMEKKGKKLTKWELCRVVKELRKFKRYKQALEELSLEGLGMSAVPSEVWESSEVLKVDLSRNSIQEFPVELSSCVSLQSLILYRNKIQEWPGAILKSLNNLSCLKLDNNPLRQIPSVGFQAVSMLHILDLSGNPASLCEHPAFSSLPKFAIALPETCSTA